MHWLGASGFRPKPIVIIEDQTYHLMEILDHLHQQKSPWPAHMTVVSLERPGPDTSRATIDWLERFPFLQVASTMAPVDTPLPSEYTDRLLVLDEAVFDNQHHFCKTMARLLRPDGLLVQDIQLDTLTFLSREEWWTSIYLASTIRGTFAMRAPSCRFMSNKTGFGIGFGRELMDAGFDPREVIDKSQSGRLITGVLDNFMEQTYPLELEICQGHVEPVSYFANREDRQIIDAATDLVWWDDRHAGPELSGRKVSENKQLRPKTQEQTTWRALFDDYFDAGCGVPVDVVGKRLAAKDALKAERTNAAARHIHALRSRLCESELILTEDSAYRLNRELVVGRVSKI